MDKVDVSKATITTKVHQFYCDGCNKFLGKSIEYDDGYYETFGEVSSIFVNDIWYQCNKVLCSSCKKKLWLQISSYIKNLGFTVEDE